MTKECSCGDQANRVGSEGEPHWTPSALGEEQRRRWSHFDQKGAAAKVRLSELFRPGTDTLILYHYMFPRHRSDKRRGPSSAELPVEEGPCPSCTALLDNWEGAVPHVEGLGATIAAVAKAPIERVAAFAAHRGWRNLKLLSAASNSFKRD
jgi:predicted dithiol-disulfide oxidoreductase (DUF899 family)